MLFIVVGIAKLFIWIIKRTVIKTNINIKNNVLIEYLFAGEVMASFKHVMIPMVTGSKQTHQSMNRIIVLIFCLCYAKGKDIAVQLQMINICTCIVTPLTEIQDRAWILVLVRVLWVRISRICWQFWHNFFKFMFRSSSIVLSHWNNVEKMATVQFVWKPMSKKKWRLQYYDVSLHQQIDNCDKWY